MTSDGLKKMFWNIMMYIKRNLTTDWYVKTFLLFWIIWPLMTINQPLMTFNDVHIPIILRITIASKLGMLPIQWKMILAGIYIKSRAKKKGCHKWYPWELNFLLIFIMHMFKNAKFLGHQRSMKDSLRSVIWPLTCLDIFSL